ncbi:NACHT domain-containing protein [Nonomuraea jiangxiensis]|uniref:NACHT domain-containing protein n=1 Tax=Nonomuraea jiangxiensis TaxID=633440 RepID=UPI0015A30740|nr:NACHT domain-containing protein [Nonomuraea jiangxiensis]
MAAAGGLVLLAVCVGIVAIVFQARGLQEAANVAQLVSVLLAIPALTLPLIAWWRRTGHPPRPPASADLARAEDVLTGLVAEQWRTEVVLRSLGDPAPIPVRWRLTDRAELMDHPKLVASGKLSFTGRSDQPADLAKAFRRLRRRRLVITGGPGAGKTTLAVQLLLELADTRASDEPVPVLFPLAAWDAGTYPRLHDWLAARLEQDYPALNAAELGPEVAAALVRRGRVLPVLDGLDELPDAARANVVTALNRSLADRDQMIVTSRTEELGVALKEAGDVLTATAVIAPQALKPQIATEYLQTCLPPRPRHDWSPALKALRRSTAPGLAEVASTPLGLWLIRSVYIIPGADPAPLAGELGGDAPALRAHLLDHLIPALIATRPPSDDPAEHFRPRHRLDTHTTRRYLAYLAYHFHPATTRDLAWWRIAGTTSPRLRLLARVASGVVVGLPVGLVGLLGLELDFKTVPWIAASLFLWSVAGLAIGRTAGSWFQETPGHADLRLRGRIGVLRRAIRASVGTGLMTRPALGALIGIAAWVQIWLAGGPVNERLAAGLTAALTYWLGVGAVQALIQWAEQPTLTAVSTPRSSWRADRTLTLLRSIAGLVLGLVVGFATWLAAVLVTGQGQVDEGVLVSGLGLTAGLALGLVLGRHHAWLACRVVTGALAIRGRLPWRLMSFLDEAHRLGLLRAVGPIYQFRHAELHDHLATAYRRSPSPDDRS